MDTDTAGLRICVQQLQLSRRGGDVADPSGDHPRYRLADRVPQWSVRNRGAVMSQLDVRSARLEQPSSAQTGRGIEYWTVGRLARVVTMLFVAAIFVFPIVGFIAMAFRSEAG